jgi:hypothetical protein
MPFAFAAPLVGEQKLQRDRLSCERLRGCPDFAHSPNTKLPLESVAVRNRNALLEVHASFVSSAFVHASDEQAFTITQVSIARLWVSVVASLIAGRVINGACYNA